MIALQPMRIGQILDRSFAVLKTVLARSPFAFLTLVVVSFIINNPNWHDSYVGLLGVFQWIVLLPYYQLISDCWLEKNDNPPPRFFRLPIFLYIQAIGMSISVAIVGTVLMFLLIVPGVVYFINRSLAFPILVIERCSVHVALKSSKFLMTRGKWYELSSPLWRYSALMLVVMIVNLTFTFGVIGGIGFLGYRDPLSQIPVYVVLAFGSLLIAASSLYSMIAAIGFYYDLRVRYEGFGIEQELASLQSSIAHHPAS